MTYTDIHVCLHVHERKLVVIAETSSGGSRADQSVEVVLDDDHMLRLREWFDGLVARNADMTDEELEGRFLEWVHRSYLSMHE